MSQVDVWAIIDKQATDLADQILHEQPLDKVDALDRDEQWHRSLEQVASQNPDPVKDWDTPIRLIQTKAKIQEQIDKHFDIALRQIAFVSYTHQYRILKIQENIAEDNRRIMMLRDESEKMIKAYACAQQHAAAWRMLKNVRDNSYDIRAVKAALMKQEKKDEKDVLLRGLIRGALIGNRPAKGWKSRELAAHDIAIILHPLIEQYALAFSEDIGSLSTKIAKLIFTEPSLRNAYDENAKVPLSKPMKMRKMKL